MIAGFILGGRQSGPMIMWLLRGIGPSLSGFGVPNPLADPTLELRNSNGALLLQHDWGDNNPPGPQNSAGKPIGIGHRSTLPPGLYTALLAGLNNGVALAWWKCTIAGRPSLRKSKRRARISTFSMIRRDDVAMKPGIAKAGVNSKTTVIQTRSGPPWFQARNHQPSSPFEYCSSRAESRTRKKTP